MLFQAKNITKYEYVELSLRNRKSQILGLHQTKYVSLIILWNIRSVIYDNPKFRCHFSQLVHDILKFFCLEVCFKMIEFSWLMIIKLNLLGKLSIPIMWYFFFLFLVVTRWSSVLSIKPVARASSDSKWWKIILFRNSGLENTFLRTSS